MSRHGSIGHTWDWKRILIRLEGSSRMGRSISREAPRRVSSPSFCTISVAASAKSYGGFTVSPLVSSTNTPERMLCFSPTLSLSLCLFFYSLSTLLSLYLSLSLFLFFSLSIRPAAYVGSPPLINLKLIPQSPGTRILLSPFLIYCTTRKLHRAANARMQPEITLFCESS